MRANPAGGVEGKAWGQSKASKIQHYYTKQFKLHLFVFTLFCKIELTLFFGRIQFD